MKRQHCPWSPAYGAIMHALPRDASALKRMTEGDIFAHAKPWVNRVPPATEHQLDTWTIQAVNPNPKGLGDLGDLAELSGLKKKLKKVAKKLAAPIKKVVKAQVKIVKKAAKSKIIKKLARPLAYAVGAVTGTAGLVAKADQIRTAARKAKAKFKAQADAYLPPEAAEQPQPEPVSQEQEAYNEPAQEQYAPQQAQLQYTKQSFAPVKPQYAPAAPVYQAPAPVSQAPAQNFATAQADPFANFNNVQRLAPADDEQEDRAKIVGISTAGIMENIKANPIPWGLGGLGLGFILYRAMNPSPRQRAY